MITVNIKVKSIKYILSTNSWFTRSSYACNTVGTVHLVICGFILGFHFILGCFWNWLTFGNSSFSMFIFTS